MTNIVTTDSGEKFTLFFTIRSPFSNFYPCVFKISEDFGSGKTEERCFYCTEQYYMFHKALSAGDKELAANIYKEREGRKVKALARNVKNFRKEQWDKISSDVMRRGNMAKYTQNSKLRQQLFCTYGSTLVECSPNDKEWGIGLDISAPEALSPSKWRGQNKLGHILTGIREELWRRPEYVREVNEMRSVLENFNLFSQKFFLPPKPSSLVQKQEIEDVRHNLPPLVPTEKLVRPDADKRRGLASLMGRSEINGGATRRKYVDQTIERHSRYTHGKRSRSRSRSGLRSRSQTPLRSRSRARRRSRVSRSHSRLRRHSRSPSQGIKRRRRSPSYVEFRRSASHESSISLSRSRSRSRLRQSEMSKSKEQCAKERCESLTQRRTTNSPLDFIWDNEKFQSEPTNRSVMNEKDSVNSGNSSGKRERSCSASTSSGSVSESSSHAKRKGFYDLFTSLLAKLRSKKCGSWE